LLIDTLSLATPEKGGFTPPSTLHRRIPDAEHIGYGLNPGFIDLGTQRQTSPGNPPFLLHQASNPQYQLIMHAVAGTICGMKISQRLQPWAGHMQGFSSQVIDHGSHQANDQQVDLNVVSAWPSRRTVNLAQPGQVLAGDVGSGHVAIKKLVSCPGVGPVR